MCHHRLEFNQNYLVKEWYQVAIELAPTHTN